MIQFVVLLAGLVTGPQPIQIGASASVAAIELHVDGQKVERREAAPWVFEYDFGPTFRPRRVEAIAFDEAGSESHRIEQWINYGHYHLDGRLILEVPESGLARQGRVLWKKPEERQLEYIEVRLDGRQAKVDLQGVFELPEYDPAKIHYLAIEVAYQNDLEVMAEAIFGADRGAALTTELTAVPVRLDEGGELPTTEAMAGWVQAGGQPAPVLTGHTEGAALAIVRDTQFDVIVDILLRKKREKFFAQPGRFLDTDDRVIFQMTQELPRDPRGVFRSVPLLPEYYRGGLWHVLTKYAPRLDQPVPQHLWTNVMLAGRRISDLQRPKAVVMVLGKRPKDTGGVTPAQALGYLQEIRTPFYAWAPEPETYERLGVATDSRFYAGPEGLVSLFEDLAGDLAGQRTLWIEGRYAPGEITLGDTPEGITLVE